MRLASGVFLTWILMRLFSLPGSRSSVPRGIEVISGTSIMNLLRRLPGILNVYSLAEDQAVRRFIAELVVILVQGGIACSHAASSAFVHHADKEVKNDPTAFHIFYDSVTGNTIAFGSGCVGNKSVWPILMCACRTVIEHKPFPSNPLSVFIESLYPRRLPHDIKISPVVTRHSAGGNNRKGRVEYLWTSRSYRSSQHVHSTMKLWKE